MKKLFLILFLSVTALQAQYYVGLTASGSGNGSNWANKDAWSNNWWGSVNAGDTVFVDGGVDSVTYTSGKDMGKSGSSGAGNITGSVMAGNYICIMPGRYSPDPTNHSGKVIMEPSGAGFENSGGYDYIYIKGFTIRNGSGRGVYMYNGTSHIILDSLTIYEMDDMGTWWESSSYIEIKNCIIISKLDNTSPADDNNFAQYSDHFYIHHNFFHMRNGQYSGGTNHLDNFQMSAYNHAVYFYNNVCLTDSGVQGHNIILGTNSQNGTSDNHDTTFVYNNYFYNGGDPGCNYQRSVYFRYPEDQAGHPLVATMVAINNTVVTSNWGAPGIDFEGGPGYASNNIIIHQGVNGSAPSSCTGGDFDFAANSTSEFETTNEYNTYADSQHTNLFYRVWTSDGIDFAGAFVGAGGSPVGAPSNFSDWVSSYGGDGVNGDPDLIKNWRIYTSSNNPYETGSSGAGIGKGTNMSYWLNRYENYLPDFDASTDIAGKERGSVWDIGCFEYGAGEPAVDSLPNSFTFTDVTNAELSQGYESNGVTLAGFDSAYARAGGAEYVVYPLGVAPEPPLNWVTGYTKVFPTDKIKVRLISSSNYSTAVNVTLTVGSRSDTYTVTTGSAPPSGNGKLLKSADGKVIKDANGNKIIVRF